MPVESDTGSFFVLMGMSHMQLNKLHGLPSDFFAAVQFVPLCSVACTRNRSSVSVFVVCIGIGEI